MPSLLKGGLRLETVTLGPRCLVPLRWNGTNLLLSSFWTMSLDMIARQTAHCLMGPTRPTLKFLFLTNIDNKSFVK